MYLTDEDQGHVQSEGTEQGCEFKETWWAGGTLKATDHRTDTFS